MEDLAQDVFVIAFQRLNRFDGRASLETWLHGIAINVARNHWRKRTRRRDLAGQAKAALPGAELSASEGLEREQAVARLYEALARLPDREREAFVVRVIEQTPLAQAAEVLGAALSTISERATRAERAIREHLDWKEA